MFSNKLFFIFIQVNFIAYRSENASINNNYVHVAPE